MKKGLFLIIVLLAMTSMLLGQEGQAVLKIVVDDNGNVAVFDMQGNPVGQGNLTDQNKVLDDLLNSDSPEAEAYRNSLEGEGVLTQGGSADAEKAGAQMTPDQKFYILQDLQTSDDPAAAAYRENLQSSGLISGGVELSIGDNQDSSQFIRGNAVSDDAVEMQEQTEDETGGGGSPPESSADDDEQANVPGADQASTVNLMFTSSQWTWSSSSCTLRMQSTVKNAGSTSSAACRLGYYLTSNTNLTTADPFLGYQTIPGLNPNASVNRDATFNLSTAVSVPQFSRTGTYYFGWYLDYQNVVAETNEGDNRLISYQNGSPKNWTFNCQVGGTPNLRIDVANTSYEYDNVTKVLKLKTRVKNFGDGPAGGSSKLVYYLSPDQVITKNVDCAIGDDGVGNLAAGAWEDNTFSRIICNASCGPGVWYVGWICDVNNTVHESNENDNTAHSGGTINMTCEPPPNLTLDGGHTNWSFNPNTCLLQINSRVINNGQGSAVESWLGYYLSTNTDIRTSDHRIANDRVKPLPRNDFSDESETIDLNTVTGVPSFDRHGTYYLGWIVDYKKQVTESNEGDNALRSNTTIRCPDNQAPNLTLDLQNSNWQYDPNSCILTIDSRVINVGTAHAGTSRLGYYLSTDTNIVPGSDSRIGDDGISGLNPGQWNDEHFSADLNTVGGSPPFSPSGSYYVGWYCDYRFEVNESNEGDNAFFGNRMISCGGGPNLTIDPNNSSANYNNCILTINTRVVNSGSAGAGASRLGYYLSSDMNISTSDSRFGDDGVSSLPAGSGSNENLTVDLRSVTGSPPFNKNGTYYAGLIGDYLNQVAETNEGDNTALFRPAIVLQCGAQAGSIRPDAPETVSCGTKFYVPIVVGDPTAVADLFGVAFDLHYPTTFLDFAGAQITDPNGGVANFLGNDLIFLDTPNDPAGLVSIGISRKSGGGVSGSGPVVWIAFESSANTPDPTEVVWSLNNISATDADGNTLTLVPEVDRTVIGCGCVVWPGDANNDGIVSAADVLPLGLFFGRTGPSRPGASNAWRGQNVECWIPEKATYADCNGNGRVGSEDVLPIGLNFGKTHSAPAPRPDLTSAANHFGKQASSTFDAAGIAQTPTLQAEVSGTSGDTIVVNILVAEVTDLFGVAFDLTYGTDNDAITALSVEANPFFGDDLIFLPTINTATKTVSVGMSRKPGQGGVTGDGVVATAFFGGFEAVTEKTVVTFTLSNPAANDPNGETITLTIADPDSLIIDPVSSVRELGGQVPESFALLQNYPNPFNPETAIDFQIPRDSRVVLTIYDILGNQVRMLVDGQKPAGRYQAVWDGRDNAGRLLSSGIYIYKLKAGGHSAVKKMSFVK